MAKPEKICNVIVLDDDPTSLKMWERVFGKMPECKYHLTDDPKEAIDMIKKMEVDLVISEVILPNLDGYSIADLAHRQHPKAEILLTTAYECDLTRFDLKDPHFSILYKPYSNMEDIQRFVRHLLNHEDVFSDVSEDSFSENDSFPEVIEWKL